MFVRRERPAFHRSDFNHAPSKSIVNWSPCLLIRPAYYTWFLVSITWDANGTGSGISSPARFGESASIVRRGKPQIPRHNRWIFNAEMVYKEGMRKASAPKSAKRSEDAVLDQAIQQLLSATKAEAQKTGKPVDRAQLLKEGYSERFIDKVENA